MTFARPLRHAASCAAIVLCAVAGIAPARTLPLGLPIPLPAQSAHGKIQHVVIIMQENRSFDNLFQGFPGADTQPFGYNSQGQRVALQPVGLQARYDIDHSLTSFFTAYDDGKMDGFNRETAGGTQYGYVPAAETTEYFAMAHAYVLADRMFASDIDDSFISHQFIISGQANHTAYVPLSTWGCDGGQSDTVETLLSNRSIGPSIVACWNVKTLADELDRAGKTWRYYASSLSGSGGSWSAFQVIKHIRYGPDWKSNVISPQHRILSDVKAGTLANVTWVTPTCPLSDHSDCGSNEGPDWVTAVVNAVGESKFWDSTAIFLMWDEWGGWYDHVPPPYVDFDGLGFRVPLLVISPYAKQGYVSHLQYEHGSLLSFAEDQFGLERLSASDTRANSPAADCFDFAQRPRTFTPFASRLSPEYFINEPADSRVPDAE